MVEKDTNNEHQDPILTPGNLKRFLENLPGKQKHRHQGYNYISNSDIFENEINEFFKYTEVTVQFQEYRRSFEKEYGYYYPQQIVSLLDQLELTQQDKRLKSCQHLTYISLGCFTTQPHESKEQRIKKLILNNQTLMNSGAFFVIFQKLQQSHIEYDKLLNSNSTSSSNTTIVGATAEINLYLTLLYLLLETQRISPSCSFKEELVNLDPNLTEFLFSLLTKLREKQDKSFPMKKVVLLLWKSLLFVSGGFGNIKSNAGKLKQSLGLTSKKKNKKAIITKCTPQDLLLFQTEITEKYPGYEPPDFPFHVTSPMTIQASSSLAEAIGYANATQQVELLYQTLIPPKSGVSGGITPMKKHPLLQNYFASSSSPALALPLTHEGLRVPQSVEEAGQVYLDNLYVSLSNYQLIEERSKALHRWQNQKKTDFSVKEEKTDLLERVYAKVLPDLQNMIVALLKLLLMAVSPVPSTSNSNGSNNNNKNEEEEKHESSERTNAVTLEYLEEVDVIRDREVYSKAISGILLLLLKWAKSSHVLKFEHVSLLLADSGCLLLILKIVGLQELADLVKACTDVPYYNFFDYNINRKTDDPKEEEETQEEETYTNRRNMFWAINYLRILQMLTKYKTHRIMLLVQYKSAAILKRISKIDHPVLEQYILKLLKSQVPYLGRKWRSQNMKIISAIYLRCKTSLRDDWISKINAEDDVEEGRVQEKSLRILIRLYHSERYNIASYLPLHDEVNAKNGCAPTGPGFNGFCTYDLDQITGDFETINILSDADQALFNQIIDIENAEDIGTRSLPNPVDAPAPSTPYPYNGNNDTRSFLPEQLTDEINKLYIQEMNSEFNPIPPLTSTENEPDNKAWQSPPLPKKLTPLTRCTASEYSMTYLRPAAEEPVNDDEEWQVRMYSELLARLTHVQEKTREKWLSRVDNDDGPYRFKVFEYFEQDLWSASSSSLSSVSDYTFMEDEQQQRQHHISVEEEDDDDE